MIITGRNNRQSFHSCLLVGKQIKLKEKAIVLVFGLFLLFFGILQLAD